MKLIKIMLMCILSIFLLSHSYAENDTEIIIDEENKAQALLLQMQERLLEHVEKAKEIAQRVEDEGNNSQAAERLNELVEELEVILSELEELDVESKTNEELRELFDQYREEIKEISIEFREIVHEVTDETRRDVIKERVKERVETFKENRKEKIQELRDRIKAKENAYLIEKAKEIADEYNLSEVEELANDFESGEITREEFVLSLRELAIEHKELFKKIREERADEIQKVKEKRKELKEQVQDKRKEARDKAKEKIGIRVSERLDNLDDEEILKRIRSLNDDQIEQIKTVTGKDIKELNDDELLALFEQYRPAVEKLLTKRVINNVVKPVIRDVRGTDAQRIDVDVEVLEE